MTSIWRPSSDVSKHLVSKLNYHHDNTFVFIQFDLFKDLKYVGPLGGSSMDGFSAIKMTALGRPQFLVGSKG